MVVVGWVLSGLPMVDSDPDPTVDYDLYYMCDTQTQWILILRQFIVIKDADEDARNDFLYIR